MITNRPPRLAITMAASTAVVWFVHLAVSYALVPTSCRMQSTLPLLVVTLIGVAIGIAAAIAVERDRASPGTWSDRLAVALRVRAPSGDGETDAPAARVATTGLALSGYFTFVMLLAALVPILVDPCA